jgi:hypothetical protein
LKVERKVRRRPKTGNPALPRKLKRSLNREKQLLEELADLGAENAYIKNLMP